MTHIIDDNQNFPKDFQGWFSFLVFGFGFVSFHFSFSVSRVLENFSLVFSRIKKFQLVNRGVDHHARKIHQQPRQPQDENQTSP